MIGLMTAPDFYPDAPPELLGPAVLGALLVLAASFYASGRVYLVFPLIAVDRPGALAASLALTRGRAWRIFCISIVPAIVLTVPALATLVPLPKILADMLKAGIQTCEQIVVIAALALAYRSIAEGEGRPALDLSPAPPRAADPARS